MSEMKIEVKADIINLMVMAAKEINYFPLSVGFQIATTYLKRIAERAIEIKDPSILDSLEKLGVISGKIGG